MSAQNSKSRQRSSRRSEGGYNHEDSRILKEPSVKQRFPETLSNNLCADGNLPYYMLGQRFDPLSDDRGVSPLISMPVMSKESICVSPFPRQSSVVSPSVDQDAPDSNISTSDIQETPTKSLYESLQRTIAGRPLPPRDYSSDPSQWETTGDVESWQRNHAGFICSMSIDNSTAVNFEASPLHNDLQLTIYGTASIQELEPYTDSIITLFGGGSDFLE